MQRLMQLAFDFLDGQGFKQKQPQAQDIQGHAAPESVAGKTPAPPAPRKPPAPPVAALPSLPSLLAPAEFRHPQARRELLLGDAVVAYALTRARRRSIGFTVGPDGLSVRAPAWVTLTAVDDALREKSGWILRKLTEARERQQRIEGGRIVWADGATLPYLGQPLTVTLDPGHGFAGKGAALEPAAPGAAQGEVAQGHASEGHAADVARQLRVALPRGASAEQIRDAVQAWLMRDARRHFTARLDHFAPLLGVRWASLRLSSATTRWGSAKSDGSIRLNWRLMHYRPAIIDYVVAHELAHLREMNHSPRFWDTVATVVPDHAQLRRHLRDQPVPGW